MPEAWEGGRSREEAAAFLFSWQGEFAPEPHEADERGICASFECFVFFVATGSVFKPHNSSEAGAAREM